MATTYERFWAQVDRTGGPEACWPWTGGINADGTGWFEIRRRRTTARRYAYRMQHGDPGPLRVTVTCGLVVCVNWRHMRLAEPRAVALSNGSAAAVNAARGACPHGHERTRENRYVHPGDGRSECLACKQGR